MVSELKFTKKQIKEFLGGLMSLNCTNGVCILYILFLWTCIFQDFYRILQVIASTNLREMKKILLNCLLLVALVGLFPRLAAQNITFKHLSTDNGLSQISVNTRVRDNILKSKEQKNIQPTKGGHKMVTCQNYVSLFYRQITSCPSDGGIS